MMMITIVATVAFAVVALAVAVRFVTGIRKAKNFKQLWCVLFNGRHELYRAHNETRLFQQCLLCGYDTAGITIDRRDRRLHLVASNPTCKPTKSVRDYVRAMAG